jgi:ribosome biogenesis protein BMS1
MPPEKKKKQHRARQSGTKADKKQAKKDRRSGKLNVKGQNPKAFGRSSAGITARIQQARKAEIQERKLHAPLIDRSYAAEEPPPIVVGVVVSKERTCAQAYALSPAARLSAMVCPRAAAI